MGQAFHGIADWFSDLASGLGAACASVFHGIKGLLAAIFSWETLLWFLAAGGLIGFAVFHNHPGEFGRWIDQVNASGVLFPRIALITLVPLLFVLIAVGRMQGVPWNSRKMTAVGLVLLVGGLVWLTYIARSAAQFAPQPTEIAEPFSAEAVTTPAPSVVDMNVQVDGQRAAVVSTPDGSIAIQVADTPSQVEAPELPFPEEIPGEIQFQEPVDEERSIDEPPSEATEELEVVQIQLIDEAGQAIDVTSVPDWVDDARHIDRRTIAVDTNWHPSILAEWMDSTPDEAKEHTSTGTMLYGEVATLHQNQFGGQFVVSVAHVGSIDEGEKVAEFAAGRIAYDRLIEFYPQVRGWSPIGFGPSPSRIAERCVETAMLHVGDFEVPVYTYHALVRIDDAGEAAVVNQWQQHEQHERLVMGGIGLGGIVWLLAIVAAYLRMSVATAGRHRTLLRVGALACLAAPLVALMFMHGM